MIKYLKNKIFNWLNKKKSTVKDGAEENSTEISDFDNMEKEKLRAKLANRLNKLEVEKSVAKELSTMDDEMERAKLTNMLNKMDIEDKLNRDLKTMEEEEELAKHLNRINKLDIEDKLVSNLNIKQEEHMVKRIIGAEVVQDLCIVGKARDNKKANLSKDCKEDKDFSDDDLEKAKKINRLQKSEIEERLFCNLKNLEDEQEKAKIINRMNKHDVEDKLVRNLINIEKDEEMDKIVNMVTKDDSVGIFASALMVSENK